MHPSTNLDMSNIEEGHENPDQPRLDFSKIRSFRSSFGSSLKETLFPDDPFKQFRSEQSVGAKVLKGIKYFCPIVEWGASYSLRFFQADLLAGLTIATLAIPQGISYAKLANLPPIIGLYSSFVPPLVYAFFGTSRDLAVGTVASCSLMAASIIGAKVSVVDDPELYLNLFYTAAFCSGVYMTAMGLFRLGFLVDFLSRPTIVGFMGGTSIIIILQQLKGFLGLEKFTPNTDVISVLHIIFYQVHEMALYVNGFCLLAFLIASQYVKKRKPKLFWLSAASPMVVVIIGGLLAFIFHLKERGIQIVGPLNKGLNPLSIHKLNFQPGYFGTALEAGLITGTIAMAEGMAVGRIFGVVKNYQIDGNKEMIAFGVMNIAGSFTSCYLTTGPFSKSAVNCNAGSMTAASNIVMAIIMMMVLLFMAPLFSYTPLVSLSAIITAAMIPLIKYKEIYRFYVIDKVDFLICMAAFVGVAFVSMDVGLLISVGLSVVRALLYVARPGVSKMGRLGNTGHYRDFEQYPDANNVSGMLVLHMGSPLFFASAGYFRDRIARWVEEEQEMIIDCKGEDLQYVILDLGGVSTIDKTGIDMLVEVRKSLEKKGIKLVLSNPKIDVMEKIVLSAIVEVIGKEYVFISVEDAVSSCRYLLEVGEDKP